MAKKRTSREPDLPRVKTGIAELDQMLYGGFLPQSANLIEGAPGTGKTTLGMQFIYNGITRYDEPGLILTFEEFPQQYRVPLLPSPQDPLQIAAQALYLPRLYRLYAPTKDALGKLGRLCEARMQLGGCAAYPLGRTLAA